MRDVVGVELELALGQDPRREVRDGDAQVVVVEVDPDRDAGGGVEREQDRRAAALVAVRGGRLGALDTSPSAWSSETRLETVERERPVRRAISAREISPSSRSASITRRRLRRRSVSSDPVRPAAMAVSDPIPPRLSIA